MTSSPRETSSRASNETWRRNLYDVTNESWWAWLLIVSGVLLVGLASCVTVGYTATRWRPLRRRLRHFRWLGDALIGQCWAGGITCAAGLAVAATSAGFRLNEDVPEVLCRACAALPQLVLSSTVTSAALLAASHGACVRPQETLGREVEIASAIRKASPFVVALATTSVTTATGLASGWLLCACANDAGAAYRPEIILSVAYLILTTGAAMFVFRCHVTLSRAVSRAKKSAEISQRNGDDVELLPVNSKTTSSRADEDPRGSRQLCRISCEQAGDGRRADTPDDRRGPRRCSSKMRLPSSSSLLKSSVSSFKSSQKSVRIAMTRRRAATEAEEDDATTAALDESCDVRMRRLFQRRRAAACRRHTVAHIITAAEIPHVKS